ncbi:MAG: class I SAM-dependent methyltransferase [Bacteroidota bacterium]
MWNTRYAQKEYVYGKQPNTFFKEQLSKLQSGKILLPAEGEGRNAVYAAKNAWDVTAFDGSSEAKKKAEKFALENNVIINYEIISFEDANYKESTFDLIALIFAHTTNRRVNHQKLIQFLKPGGILILEGFSKNQINNDSGGPRKPEMLFSRAELETDFFHLSAKEIWEEEIILNEGNLHSGKSSVMRLIGRK